MLDMEALPQPLRILEQLFSLATRDAAAAMCRWTSGQVSLSLDELQDVDVIEACSALGMEDQQRTMVALDVDHALGGQILLAFDEADGRRFAASILGEAAPPDGPWTELEKSVLMETGNILGCAYMNTMARVLQLDLIPSPPCFIQDYAAAVLQQIVQKQAMTTDRLLVCRTSFRASGEELQWQVLFIPTDALRMKMESLCDAQP
jgi:chemotaxis protein CheC